ncbi:hypothetical protein GGQ22_04135 [Nocardioides sp. zg-579]|uniref:PepSY domain-containing protein n=1 Tax=Nocardioides marmotae TaxID=2663857 RepID=A0A6I3J1Q3_9ACTN|nr:PepSY domain-containing protein [Nocardioides marmotae]MCR6030630.1 hypothetical protein [Gordonia jinghuaiqii]MTB94266.1 hypothetical protein [Nocardioides marmotae]QKE00543.1 PepSY domain-containing protein [Nocardioides marmotae]
MSIRRTTRTARTSALAALVAAPLLLGLVACGDDDNGDDATDTSTSASPSASPSTSPSTSPTDALSTEASPTVADDAVVLDAAATAAGAVPGGRLVSLDQEPRGWEAEVVDAGGARFDLTVASDGSRVTGDPVKDREDAEDRQEWKRLLAEATVDPAGAVEAARTTVPDGAVTALDLESGDPTAVWEVEVDGELATEQTVAVDAASGEVLRTEGQD